MKDKNIFLIWRSYQGRVESMKPYFNYNEYYFGKSFKSKFLRPFEYIVKFFGTFRLLMIQKPTTIWLQLPPTPLLYLAFIYKKINKNVKIISDCHNGMLRAPWINTPYALKLINSLSDLILVHNEEVYRQALKNGINAEKCMVLEDTSANTFNSQKNIKLKTSKFIGKVVLFPTSFNKDEPINEILEVATELPEITFVLTGNPERAKGVHDLSKAGENVKFTGWISKEEYVGIMIEADIVLGLTLFEGIQLSVANEAVGFEKAMVLSDTKILRELFYKGAVYAKPTTKSLKEAIEVALENKNELQKQAKQLKQERLERWLQQAKEVERRLGYDVKKELGELLGK